MSKKKKGKKAKKDKQKQQKADGNSLSRLGKNAASLGTALVGAVATEDAQATLTKMAEKGLASDRLDTVRHTIKAAAGVVKTVAGAVHAALDNADVGVVDAATALVDATTALKDNVKDKAEDTQAATGKVVGDAVEAVKEVADRATSSVKPQEKA